MSYENKNPQENNNIQPSLEGMRDGLVNLVLQAHHELLDMPRNARPPKIMVEVPGAMKLYPEMSDEERREIIERQHSVYRGILSSDPDIYYGRPYGRRYRPPMLHTPEERKVSWESEAGPVVTTITRISKMIAIAESVYLSEHDHRPLTMKAELWGGPKEDFDDFLAQHDAQPVEEEA